MNRLRGFVTRPIVVGVAVVLGTSACAGNQAQLREEAMRAAAQVSPADGRVETGVNNDTLASEAGAAATPGAGVPQAGSAGATTAASGPAAVRHRSSAAAVGSSAAAASAGRVSGPAVGGAAPAAAGTSGGGSGANPGAGTAAGPPNPGATDIGVTGDRILIGSVWFHESYLDRYSRVSEHAVAGVLQRNQPGRRRLSAARSNTSPASTAATAAGPGPASRTSSRTRKCSCSAPRASFSTGTIQEYVKAQKIPFIGSYGLYLEEYKNDNRYSFPTQVPVFDIARLFGKFLIEEVKPKSVGISYLNIEAAQECMKGLESYLSKAGVPVVAKVSNEFDEPDLTPQVLKMRQANPDIVAFCNDPLNNAKFVGVAARSQRYKPPKGWIGGWPTVPEFGKIVGDWGIGHYGFSSVCYHEAPECDANPDVKLFKAQMARHYPGEMERMHYYGQNLWCGAKMIVEALKLAGPNLTREGLLTALDSGAFHGWNCQDMQLYFKTGLRAGSRVGQMHQLDDKLRWRLVRPTYSAD